MWIVLLVILSGLGFSTIAGAAESTCFVTIVTSGNGSVNATSGPFVVGSPLVVTATAAADTLFEKWTIDGVTYSHDATSAFTIPDSPTCTLCAVFIPNPFGPAVGTYRRVLTRTTIDPGTRERTSVPVGTLTLTVRPSGTFSLATRIGGKRKALRGQLSAYGNFHGELSRNGRYTSVSIELNFESGQFAYTSEDVATGNSETANGSFPGIHPIPLPNRGTLCFDRDDGAVDSAPKLIGTGFGTFRRATGRSYIVVGVLPDGTPISLVGAPDGHGEIQIPIFQAIANGGHLSGYIGFAMEEEVFTGTMRWKRPTTPFATPSAPVDIMMVVTGARYAPPKDGLGIPLPLEEDASLTLTVAEADAGDYSTRVRCYLTMWLGGFAMTSPYDDTFASLRITARNGIFKGRYLDPVKNRTHSFRGVFVQPSTPDFEGPCGGGGFGLRGGHSDSVWFDVR